MNVQEQSKVELEMHRALLRQIHGMYDNAELRRVCQDGLQGKWDSVFYDKYKPESLKKK